MNCEDQRNWDAWLEAHIRVALEHERKNVLTPGIGEALSELRHEFDGKIAKLRAELGGDSKALNLVRSDAAG